MNATAAWFEVAKAKRFERFLEPKKQRNLASVTPQDRKQAQKDLQTSDKANQERWAKQAEAEEKRRAKQQRTKELESADKQEAKNRAAEAAEIKRQKEQDERAKRVKTQQDQAKAKRERDKEKEAKETARQRTAVKEGLERRGAFYSTDKDTRDTGIPGGELAELSKPETTRTRKLGILSGQPRWGQVVRNIAGKEKKKRTYEPPKDMGNIGDFKNANRTRRSDDQVRADRQKLIGQMETRQGDDKQSFSAASARLLESLREQEKEDERAERRDEDLKRRMEEAERREQQEDQKDNQQDDNIIRLLEENLKVFRDKQSGGTT